RRRQPLRVGQRQQGKLRSRAVRPAPQLGYRSIRVLHLPRWLDLDYGTAIAIGPGGNVFVTGYTESLDFPTVNPEQAFFAGSSAIFVSKLAVNGSALIYS